jgi:hypothetical protein
MPYLPQRPATFSHPGPVSRYRHPERAVSSGRPRQCRVCRASLPFLIVGCLFLFSREALNAQDCGCTATQVQSNTVPPCTDQTGVLRIVRNEQEFRSAINEANARGGSMTILLENGVYRVASAASYPYLTGSNVIVRSVSGARDSVILEGEGMRDVNPATENGLLIAGDHVTIADLTIRNVGNHGIQVNGHGLLVHNVRIQDTYQQMLKGATERAVIDSGIVQCCLFAYTAGVGPN